MGGLGWIVVALKSVSMGVCVLIANATVPKDSSEIIVNLKVAK